jgi:arabinose-5-phosphate isomerase
MSGSQDAARVGQEVIRKEASALEDLAKRLGPEFEKAVERILRCEGRVILCGIGKSGQIAQKITSTLVSTGTPAGFLHPAEGFHGDVGIVTSRDVVLAVSNSGETKEVLELIPVIKALGAGVIALCGPKTSSLARAADIALCWGDVKEADPLGLVPTVSGALTLALGDALTVSVMVRRGFGAKDYALVHPSGAIGRKLSLRVVDLLRGAATNPTVGHDATFEAALETVTKHTLGGVCVVDPSGRLVGIVTDGDVRRTIAASRGSVKELLARPVSDFMTKSPTTVAPDTLAFDALRLMESHRPRPIYLLPVVDAEGKAVGMIHLHTLVQAGLTGGAESGAREEA